MATHFTHSSENCIWMDAGVLTYKLCDRGFDCEHCPLDAALRDQHEHCLEDDYKPRLRELRIRFKDKQAPEVKKLLAPLVRLPFNEDVQYSPQHLWIRDIDDGNCKIGMDAFAAALLPEDTRLVMTACGTPVNCGEAFGWAYSNIHILPLLSPVNGIITCKNNKISRDIETIRSEPYGGGCLVTIEPDSDSPGTCSMLTPEAMRTKTEKDVRAIVDDLFNKLNLFRKPSGIMLNDGGPPVGHLEGLLGKDAWWNIIERYFLPAA